MSTINFSEEPRKIQRGMLRNILNADLRELRKEHYIDGDYKWLFINTEDMLFPEDQYHTLNINKGAFVSLGNLVGVLWQKALGLCHALAERLNADILLIAQLMLQIVRQTPRGVSRPTLWERGLTIKENDNAIVKALKIEFTMDELDKFGMDFGNSILVSHAHIESMNVHLALNYDVLTRMMRVLMEMEIAGVTVYPQFDNDRVAYKSLGFEDYALDGLMRYTNKTDK